MSAEIPDEVARAALDIATAARREPWQRRADIQGVRDAIAHAYAAGRESAYAEGKVQWGLRTVGYKTVRIRSERTARSLLRGYVVPGELVSRPIGPWTVTE